MGPTIVALALDRPVHRAAKYFVYVSASAMLARILVALIVQRVGRLSSASWRRWHSASPGISTRW